MNLSSLVKLGLLVMQIRGASSVNVTYLGLQECLDLQDRCVGEFRNLADDPNSANNFVHVEARMRYLLPQITANYKQIQSCVDDPKIKDYIGMHISYITQFRPADWDDVEQTLGEIRTASYTIITTFKKVIYMIRQVKIPEEDVNKVKERISDLVFQWGQVKEYYTRMMRGKSIARNYDTISTDLQYHLLRSLDLLSKLESRISAIQSTRPSSYGCAKAIELIEKEREYVAAIYEHSKNLTGSGPHRYNYAIVEIDTRMEKEHYLKDLERVWKRFANIVLGIAPGTHDVDGSYAPAHLEHL